MKFSCCNFGRLVKSHPWAHLILLLISIDGEQSKKISKMGRLGSGIFARVTHPLRGLKKMSSKINTAVRRKAISHFRCRCRTLRETKSTGIVSNKKNRINKNILSIGAITPCPGDNFVNITIILFKSQAQNILDIFLRLCIITSSEEVRQ